MLEFFAFANKGNDSGGGITPTLKLNLVFDGNSITFGSYNTLGIDQYFPKLVRDYYINRPEVIDVSFSSYGVGGQTLSTMLSLVDPNITTRVKDGYINILVVNEDINDILNSGATAQGNFNNIESYCAICKAAGYDYILHWTTYYPRVPYNQPGWDSGSPTPLSIQKDFFDLVKAADINNVSWDAHRDLRDSANLGGDESQDYNQYFYDSVHLADIGYNSLALDEIVPEINNYLMI